MALPGTMNKHAHHRVHTHSHRVRTLLQAEPRPAAQLVAALTVTALFALIGAGLWLGQHILMALR